MGLGRYFIAQEILQSAGGSQSLSVMCLNGANQSQKNLKVKLLRQMVRSSTIWRIFNSSIVINNGDHRERQYAYELMEKS